MSLASRTASSSVSKQISGATGPNVSSRMTHMTGVRTSGLPVSARPISTHRRERLRGRPAAQARAVSGVCFAGFTTIVQPAACAAPALRVIICGGKFQRVMAAHTPTGCFSTSMRLPRRITGSVSPKTRFACSANHSMKNAAQHNRAVLRRARAPVGPGGRCRRDRPLRIAAAQGGTGSKLLAAGGIENRQRRTPRGVDPLTAEIGLVVQQGGIFELDYWRAPCFHCASD